MKNRPLHLPKSVAGYTLVEMLIAMLIGLFLLAGAFQITQANKRNNVLQKSIQQVQKDGRFAVDHLTYAIKTAGYAGFYESLYFLHPEMHIFAENRFVTLPKYSVYHRCRSRIKIVAQDDF